MLNPTNPLGSSDIGRIVGVFGKFLFKLSMLQAVYLHLTVITSAVGWVVTFTFATLFVSLAFLAASSMTKLFQRCYRVKIHQVSDISAPKSCNPNDSLYTASEASKERRSTHTKDSFWSLLVRNWAMLVSFTCIFTVGIPVAARTSDHRAMDGFTLWFLWLGCVKLQGKLKLWAKRSAQTSKLWVILATVANPVLFATLLLTAYTRAKASLMGGPHILDRVLAMLSSGTPLYEILTSATSHVRLPHNQSAWFGAGDLALSALECGIVVWGFKLFECRKQLLSIPGACTILICIMVAVGNVYLSVIVGHAVGLKSSEALAFAARNTTLALAKPAMEAIGGNTVVNAALVVGNGIIGQILYPFVMHKLVNPFAIWCEATTPSQPTISREPSVTNSDGGSQATVYLNPSDNDPHTKDSALTVATGIAVGVNGAAMGVSYLYEHDHPAAPYAVLAMTVYGISTVILTTVDPFKTSAMALAR